MDYLTNYYKNLSEQLQAKVNYLQNLIEEEAPKKQGLKLSIIDRVSGSARSRTGEGAKYIAIGEDGNHYSFYSNAKWAFDNEGIPSPDKKLTYEVNTGNPEHEIQDLQRINWDNKHHSQEFGNYKPQ